MKKKIAVIMGGYSSEKAISIKSGKMVCAQLDEEKYEAFEVHILKEGWKVIDKDSRIFPIDKNDFSFTSNGIKVNFDCVFNAIHGAPGENGTILAYFDLINLPFTSAPFYQMALTFNKRDCLSVVKQYGIKTAKSCYLNLGDNIDEDDIETKVGFPCFVKPNGGGSSFGISKVYTKDKLKSAIKKAFNEDSEILIESFLEGPEVSVGVIEYDEEIKVLPITEIVSENDFFDYEAKYEGKSQEITPARISSEMKEKVEKVAKKVYQVLGMKGFSRAEYILVDGEPYFLEINTVPGLTAESILPQQAKEANISMASLFDYAIQAALNK